MIKALRTEKNFGEMLKIIGNYYFRDKRPDPLKGVLIDYFYGAQRSGSFITSNAKLLVAQISAERDIIEKRLARKASLLAGDKNNPALRAEVRKLARGRLTLRTLERIGEGLVSIETIPISTNKPNQKIAESLNWEFGNRNEFQLTLPARPIESD
jgi:hypothetical protein